jgi:hypothetical protein
MISQRAVIGIAIVTWLVVGFTIRTLLTRAIVRDYGRSWVDASLSTAERLPGRAAVYRRLLWGWYGVVVVVFVAAAIWFHFNPDPY